jgi:nucleoside-diphosphate-sugar epimerase
MQGVCRACYRTGVRVFLAGATGALGRPTLERLLGAGHRVRALVRREADAQWARERGAEPVEVDLFDPSALGRGVAGCDAVLHFATKIPPPGRITRRRGAENDRLRRDASRLLVDAAAAAGAGVYVQESIAFVYADGGDAWLDETAPLHPSWLNESALAAEHETARFARSGGRGVSLRFAAFYAPWARSSRDAVRLARRGWLPVPGTGEQFFSSIHVGDAADAALAALEAQSGVYNVADDEPLPLRDYVEALTRASGGRRVRRLPARPLRWLLGEASHIALVSRRVSNRRFREATGWRPVHPCAREGLVEVTRQILAAA